jgi:membrane-bound ClpP family serine protease
MVHGEYWDAVSRTAIEEGAGVRVTAIDGLTLTVESAPKKEGGTP